MQFNITPKSPWWLRCGSDRQRRLLVSLGSWVGIIGYFIWFFGGLLAVIFGPIGFALWQPDAPISRPVIWLLMRFGPAAFFCGYYAVMAFVAFVLLWGIQVYDYSRSNRAA